VAQLKETGAVRRGWIGARVRPAADEVAPGSGAKVTQGALVVEPQPNSPAARAGLAAGDIITSLNDESIKNDRELTRKIAALAPGARVKLTVLRNGEVRTIMIRLGEPPASRSEAPLDGPLDSGGRTGLAMPAVQ